MPSFIGTEGGDRIVPDFVTPGVIVTGGSLPGAGADTLDGRGGDDGLQGGGGNDLILGGTGNDVIMWNLGDGTDSIDGGADHDFASFQTDPGADTVTLGHNGALATMTVNGALAANMAHVEDVAITTWDGVDNITVGDLSATDVTAVEITLQGYSSLGDGAVDTVAMTGSAGNDVVQIFQTGPDSQQVWTNFANGHALAVNIDTIEVTDRFVFNLGAGDDTLWDWQTICLGQVTINGEAGNDFLFGTTGPETLTGGTGNDTLQGNGGHDSLSGDAGNDSLQGFGAGGDTLSGGGGNDSITFTGVGDSISGGANDDRIELQSGGPDDISGALTSVDGGTGTNTLLVDPTDPRGSWSMTLRGSGAHAHLVVDETISNFFEVETFYDGQVDLANIDAVRLVGAPGGFSFFDIGDLTGTGIKSIDVDLGAKIGSAGQLPDAQSDFLTLEGTSAGDHIVMTNAAPGVMSVAGMSAAVTIRHFDAADFVDLFAGAGNDVIEATPLNGIVENSAQFVIHGGDGTDTLQINAPNTAGEGWRFSLVDDTYLDAGIVVGQTGTSARISTTDVEAIRFNGSTAADSFFIQDLSSTMVRSVVVDMGATAGGAPDTSQDSLTVVGSLGAESIVATAASGVLTLTGLLDTVTVLHMGVGDRLELDAGAGRDFIDLSRAGAMSFQHNVDAGSGDDTIVGSSAPLIPGGEAKLFGGDGNDSLAGGVGDNWLWGGNGADTLSTSGGHSTTIHLNRLDLDGDTIANFHPHAAAGATGDVLELSGFAERTFAALAADGHVVQSGANLLIVDGSHIVATLVGVTSLTASDVFLI